MNKELQSFRLQVEIPVKWGDMDAFQHVNNTVYLRWIEHARVEYIAKVFNSDLRSTVLGPILARTDIRYIFPLTYPDTVVVGFRVSEIQDDRLICESKVFSSKHQRLSAICYNTIMAYDFRALNKTDIPVDWIMKIQDWEK